MPKKHKSAKMDVVKPPKYVDERDRERLRQEILTILGAKEFFVSGSIDIDRRTCRGIECRLCVKACPTCALFWKAGEVGITKELCVYCGACVLSCIVDGCIRITRKRSTGEVETFSKPRDFIARQDIVNARKRLERIKEVFEDPTDPIKQRKKTAR